MPAEPQATPVMSWVDLVRELRRGITVALHGHQLRVQATPGTHRMVLVQPLDYRKYCSGFARMAETTGLHYTVSVYGPAKSIGPAPLARPSIADIVVTRMEIGDSSHVNTNKDLLRLLLSKLTPELVEAVCGS